MNGTFVLEGSDASADSATLDTTFATEPKVLRPILTDKSNKLNNSEDDFILEKSRPDSSSSVDLVETSGINRKRKLHKTKYFAGI